MTEYPFKATTMDVSIFSDIFLYKRKLFTCNLFCMVDVIIPSLFQMCYDFLQVTFLSLVMLILKTLLGTKLNKVNLKQCLQTRNTHPLKCSRLFLRYPVHIRNTFFPTFNNHHVSNTLIFI